MTATLAEPYRPSREAGLSGSRAKSLTPRRPAAALLLPRARFGFMLLWRTATHSLTCRSRRSATFRECQTVHAQCLGQREHGGPDGLTDPLLKLGHAEFVQPSPVGQFILRQTSGF